MKVPPEAKMKHRLSTKETIIVASTLFGMFFGAGNLIFPVHLGQLAGCNAWPAALGFIITGVGIPILGVAAIGASRSDGLLELSSKVGKGYGYLFTCILYLTIGPFFAIPRCATTSFTTGFSPLFAAGTDTRLFLFLFSFAFFAVVLFFSLKPQGITVWIGKIINPVFLCFLLVLVIASLTHPAAAVCDVVPEPAYEQGAFFNGFIEGYGTMDAIAGLAFGIVVITIIRSFGIEDESDISRDVLRSGIWTGALMALIYILTIVMGTQSRGLFEVSANGGIALSMISGHYLGPAGNIVLAVTITLACLKTAIGLVTSCSETFRRISGGRLSYSGWAVIITAFSFIVSNIGLNGIIAYSIPVLMLIYPLTITLIALGLSGKAFDNDRCVYRWVTGCSAAAALFDFFKALPEGIRTSLRLDTAVRAAEKFLPFFNLGLGWLIPAAAGLATGLIIHSLKQRRSPSHH